MAATETFESTSPADGATIGAFPRSTAEDVDRAVATAKAAYDDWRLTPAPKRGEILFRVAQALEREKAALSDLVTHEMGKVKAEAGGDVQEAIDITYYMAGEGRRLFGHTTPSELQNKWNMSIRVPIGVVGAITPWNFPIAIPSWKSIPALICGNTVVLKPAEDTPALAQRFVELLARSGHPRGRRQHRARLWRRRGRCARASSRRSGDHVHRLARDGNPRREGRGRAAQAPPRRARRQERDHRPRRRRSRPRGRRHRLVGVRHLGSALHRRVARHRPARRVRRAPEAARRPRREAAPRTGLGGRDGHRPAHQPRGAREDALVHRDR